MATITSAKLEVGNNSSTGTSNCIVTCRVTFTKYEQNEMKEGLKFALHCALWGEDNGPNALINPDDFIFSYASKHFPDATPSSPEMVTFNATLGTSLLNEDFGTDEVYGRLRLKNLYTGKIVSAKTNVIKRHF